MTCNPAAQRQVGGKSRWAGPPSHAPAVPRAPAPVRARRSGRRHVRAPGPGSGGCPPGARPSRSNVADRDKERREKKGRRRKTKPLPTRPATPDRFPKAKHWWRSTPCLKHLPGRWRRPKPFACIPPWRRPTVSTPTAASHRKSGVEQHPGGPPGLLRFFFTDLPSEHIRSPPSRMGATCRQSMIPGRGRHRGAFLTSSIRGPLFCVCCCLVSPAPRAHPGPQTLMGRGPSGPEPPGPEPSRAGGIPPPGTFLAGAVLRRRRPNTHRGPVALRGVGRLVGAPSIPRPMPAGPGRVSSTGAATLRRGSGLPPFAELSFVAGGHINFVREIGRSAAAPAVVPAASFFFFSGPGAPRARRGLPPVGRTGSPPRRNRAAINKKHFFLSRGDGLDYPTGKTESVDAAVSSSQSGGPGESPSPGGMAPPGSSQTAATAHTQSVFFIQIFKAEGTGAGEGGWPPASGISPRLRISAARGGKLGPWPATQNRHNQTPGLGRNPPSRSAGASRRPGLPGRREPRPGMITVGHASGSSRFGGERTGAGHGQPCKPGPTCEPADLSPAPSHPPSRTRRLRSSGSLVAEPGNRALVVSPSGPPAGTPPRTPTGSSNRQRVEEHESEPGAPAVRFTTSGQHRGLVRLDRLGRPGRIGISSSRPRSPRSTGRRKTGPDGVVVRTRLCDRRNDFLRLGGSRANTNFRCGCGPSLDQLSREFFLIFF